MKHVFCMVGLLAAAAAAPALADFTQARCEVYAKGEEQASKVLPCTFSQRQGAVSIALEDGTRYDLRPIGDTPGNYRDSEGRPAYRQSGLGEQGLIFRLAEQSVYVYWRTAGLKAREPAEAAVVNNSGSVADLVGTEWQLVNIQSMDDSEVAPAAGAVFAMTFQADGAVALQVDCNRGSGRWESAGRGQLRFGPVATTRRLCGPGSLDGRFLNELEYVRSYVVRDGHLYLATLADGAILAFRPRGD
ncbi:META domain-containing protein [Parahaliea mediterranea]|uniref:META domain-containing protein n=1 Tax=Parahaliea mediterranea TaxID=651086 RepID=UPI000E2EF5E8|nr:META domain-containing protein [Parahaliea mediterranea]